MRPKDPKRTRRLEPGRRPACLAVDVPQPQCISKSDTFQEQHTVSQFRMETADHHAQRQERQGVLCGILAYGSWGLIPLYFKLVSDIPPLEVLAHRVIWSFLFLGLLVTAW